MLFTNLHFIQEVSCRRSLKIRQRREGTQKKIGTGKKRGSGEKGHTVFWKYTCIYIYLFRYFLVILSASWVTQV